MGFLDKLWDETLAGPAPEKGVSRLRKHKSLSAVRSTTNQPVDYRTVESRFLHDNVDQTAAGVSRSITILRPKNLSVETGSGSGSGSVGSSPSTPTTPSTGPSSPFSPGELSKEASERRFARRKRISQPAEPTSPTVYDWIMISALDR